MSVTKRSFGTTKDGRTVSLITLKNETIEVSLTDLGAAIVSIIVPDRANQPTDVVLGYDTAEEYEANTCNFGAVIGRSANRIALGRFELNGKTYQLDINDNDNNLHSGFKGFDKRLWEIAGTTDTSVTFSLEDKDMEQGYPGNFKTSVTYTLLEDALKLHYEAQSDADTLANMTNHVYFNLSGHDSGSILDQEMMLTAERYSPIIDHQAIPTGEKAPVAGTVFDFTTPHLIGERINEPDIQLVYGNGYDHNYIIRDKCGDLIKVAEAYSAKTGIAMETCTDLPAIQFYAGNGMTADMPGKNGAVYQPRFGFCLETHFVPNAINMDGYEKPILKAGEIYSTDTIYRFYTR